MRYAMLMELLRDRRSVREFTDENVCDEDLGRILEAARWAPSNHNRQGWKFLVFRDQRELASLAERVRGSVTARLAESRRMTPEHAERMTWYATLFAQAACVILAMHKRSVSVGRDLLAGAEQPELVSGEPLSTAMAASAWVLTVFS